MSFDTVTREEKFKSPSKTEYDYPALQDLVRPHVDSFNAIFDQNLLELAVANLDRRELIDAHGRHLVYWVEKVELAKPMVNERDRSSLQRFTFPNECRERGISYRGKMTLTMAYKVDAGPVQYETRHVGNVPIMVKSSKCNLHGLYPADLLKRREETEEFGGYFIINGIERIIRLLIVQRRNHVLALVRNSFQKRGPLYSEYGANIRCARPDQTTQSITLHYLKDGTLTVRFSLRKQEFLVPFMLVMRALVDISDRELFELFIQDQFENTFLTERVEMLLRSFKVFSMNTKEECLAYLGAKFRIVLGHVTAEFTDCQVGQELLTKVLFVHLENSLDKAMLLVHMAKKLYAVVAGDCAPDNPDSPMHQEILLSGFLYLAFLKEKLDEFMSNIQTVFAIENKKSPLNVEEVGFWKVMMQKINLDVGKRMEYFLATGNLTTNTGMDLSQVTGYTLVAEKLNFYRYLSHFRCVHRGSFFAELKTTTVRKLLPEAWGFLCPVHTPDGSPCGLLNHLSHQCQIVTETRNKFDSSLLAEWGVVPVVRGLTISAKGMMNVLVDGCWVGYCSADSGKQIIKFLRQLKINGSIDQNIEAALVPFSNGGLYPGLYIFSGAARMMRPVVSLAHEQIEMVGSLEQVYLTISCTPAEVTSDATHVEVSPTTILSVVANLTPFSDFNQSPRNMYQCQMGKQTMGTPCHTFKHRPDNKMYRLLCGQTPLVRPDAAHKKYGLDLYPNGTNAVVAVISYTGYDMEDAMILNKASFERGFAHGVMYKTVNVDLGEKKVRGEPIHLFFGLDKQIAHRHPGLGMDGLPLVGTLLRQGDAEYAYINTLTGECKVEKYKGLEDAMVDQVRIFGTSIQNSFNSGDDSAETPLQRMSIKLRINRNPIIGDKFSSRHGQKGVCSQKWPVADLPFSDSGIVPDVIINPHAFPSRMTIGMFVESMAGKSGAVHGLCQDATPFKFSEEHRAVDYFGEQLACAGFNYYGNEPMYSGLTGDLMQADIYIGVVFYQRLRHMVSDKFQVRTVGPVHNLTRQPIKGRKKGGGIRFGEMERDSLLAHGVSFLLKDRLLECSDYSQAHVCRFCGSLLGTQPTISSVTCRVCETDKGIDVIAIPFVLRYLAAELMAMNIRLILSFK